MKMILTMAVEMTGYVVLARDGCMKTALMR